jgi:four helix bundle protein
MQLVKSADSIGANIAEGSGRSSVADRRLFVRIARGSLYETKHWLRCAYHRNLLSEKAIEELKRFMDTLTPQLNAYYRSIGETKPKVDSSVSIEAPAIQGDYTSGAKSDRLHQVSSLSETSTGLHEPQQIM